MWKQPLCIAVVGLSLVASAQAQSSTNTITTNTAWVHAKAGAVGEGTNGVYVVLVITAGSSIFGANSPVPIMTVVDTNRVPHALEIGLSAVNSSSTVVAYCQYVLQDNYIVGIPRILELFALAPDFKP